MKTVAQRANAEIEFVRFGRTLEEISSAGAISKGTLARWSKEGNWAAKRAEMRRESPLAGIEKLKRRREKLCEQIGQDDAKDAGLTDQLYKVALPSGVVQATWSIDPAVATYEVNAAGTLLYLIGADATVTSVHL